MKKILSIIITIAFIFNDLSFALAERNYSNLAVPDRLSSLQFQAEALIRYAFLNVAERLGKESGASKGLTYENLLGIGTEPIKKKGVLRDQVIGRILFGEIRQITIKSDGKTISDGKEVFAVKVEVDGRDYALYLVKDLSRGGYKISVTPFNQFDDALRSGYIVVVRDELTKEEKGPLALEARQALDRNIEYEVSSDNDISAEKWIYTKLDSGGKYAVRESVKKSNPIYSKADDTFSDRELGAVLKNADKFLESINLVNHKKIIETISGKQVVLLPYVGTDLPIVTIGGSNVRTTVLASQLATYIFLPKDMYDSVTAGEEWSSETAKHIEKELVHIAGVYCALRASVEGQRIKKYP